MLEYAAFAKQLILPVAGVTTLICVYTDCRRHTIKNIVTLPAIALGLLLNTISGGWMGLVFSAAGLLVGVGVMAVPFLLGKMGAGDVKLMGALGSLFGGLGILNIFLYTTIAGGVVALGYAVYHRDILNTLKKVWLLGKCLILFRSPGAGLSLFKKSIPMPYGLAIAIGTATFLAAGKIVQVP